MDFVKNLTSGVIAILEGMKTVFIHNFRPAITLEYPEKKEEFNARLRGHIAVATNEDGSINCIDCKSCVRVCPCGDLINIESHKGEDGKLCFDRFSIDLGRCIVCGNCVDICPKNVLLMSDEYEISKYDKNDLVYELDDLKLSYEKTTKLQSELEKGE